MARPRGRFKYKAAQAVGLSLPLPWEAGAGRQLPTTWQQASGFWRAVTACPARWRGLSRWLECCWQPRFHMLVGARCIQLRRNTGFTSSIFEACSPDRLPLDWIGVKLVCSFIDRAQHLASPMRSPSPCNRASNMQRLPICTTRQQRRQPSSACSRRSRPFFC